MDGQSDEELYRVIRTTVRAFLRGWSQGRIGALEADDIAHSVYLKLIEDDRKQLAKFEPGRGSFGGFVAMKTRFYLWTIARKYRSRDELAHFESIGDEELVDNEARGLEEALYKRERLLKVVECVEGQLTKPEERPAARLRFLHNVSDEVFMEKLGLDRKGMYRLKNRLRNLVDRCLAKHFPEDEGEDE